MYIAFRYNLLFVFNANIDTKGLVYPRALQQTTCGIYIGLVCMIGLFGINQAPGPTILMAIFLVGSILFHVSLNSAVGPLLDALPRSLEVEEEHLMALESGAAPGAMSHHSSSGAGDPDKAGAITSAHSNGGTADGHAGASLPPPHKKPSMFAKFLAPHKYTDYATLRRLVPRDFAQITYAEEVERGAYNNPAVTSRTPLLWIPRDSMGISRQEVAHTSKVLPMTDEGASFDEKGNVVWDTETPPPIHEEKVYY